MTVNSNASSKYMYCSTLWRMNLVAETISAHCAAVHTMHTCNAKHRSRNLAAWEACNVTQVSHSLLPKIPSIERYISVFNNCMDFKRKNFYEFNISRKFTDVTMKCESNLANSYRVFFSFFHPFHISSIHWIHVEMKYFHHMARTLITMKSPLSLMAWWWTQRTK